MSCDEISELKGLSRLFLIRSEDGTKWQLVGGVKSINIDASNPTAPTTNQATTGKFATSSVSGLKSISINVSGHIDLRAGEVINGYEIASSSRLVEIYNSDQACAEILIFNTVTGNKVEGCFTLANLGTPSETETFINFEAAFESKGGVTWTGVV